MRKTILAALLIVAAAPTILNAGGPPPMYVVVDRVVFEPNDQKPTSIQIWGWFTRLESRNTEYTKPTYGFVYLGDGCADDAPLWKKAVRSGKAVTIGSCHDAGTFMQVPIHAPNEKVAKPDAVYSKDRLCLWGDLHAVGDLARQPEVIALLRAAKVMAVDNGAMMKFIQKSVLDGLTEDGVPREFAAQLAANPDYVGKCALCAPTREAFVVYSKLDTQPEGKGLKEDLRKRLAGVDVPARHEALRELVQMYMERGYAKAKLPAEERLAMQQRIEEHRKSGSQGLSKGQKFCPSCEGASCSLPR